MQLSVRLQGLELAKARLATVNRNIDPVMRGALNTTATATRRERFARPMGKAFPTRLANSKMRIKRARRGMMNARIIPSSSGIEVTRYRSWGFDRIDATRARIWVIGPQGKKIAAGFVNPSSSGRRPLATRSQKRTGSRVYTYRRDVREAQAPSLAYWFARMADRGTVRWTNAFLMREFERRIRAEMAKGAR